MLVALHNPFERKAENELAQRMIIAFDKLGVTAKEVHTSDEIHAIRPDFVISLHHYAPKLTGYRTYGCVWNPRDAVYSDKINLKSIRSYDGYLVSGTPALQLLNEIRGAGATEKFETPIYTSSFATPYREFSGPNRKIFYAGTNWDGRRYSKLFKALSSKDLINVFGPAEAWNHIPRSYRGSIPFDGTSIIEKIRESGVGLVLHKKEHVESGIPSMRIFETVAAGAVAICQHHPFIEQEFGTSVLYLSPNANEETMQAELETHMDWIQKNPTEGSDLARKAHQIFNDRFSLETLFKPLIDFETKRKSEKEAQTAKTAKPLVSVIVRIGGRSTDVISRALASIENQTLRERVQVLLVKYKDVPGLESVIQRFGTSLDLKIIDSQQTGFRSTSLFEGLKKVDTEFFAILDDDDEWFENHLESCIGVLRANPSAGIAYAGSIRWWEESRKQSSLDTAPENREIAFFEPFDLARLARMDNFITSNSFVGRSSVLAEIDLNDPELVVLEDLYLLLAFAFKSNFSTVDFVTSQFSWRDKTRDNSSFMPKLIWFKSSREVKELFAGSILIGKYTISRGPFVSVALRFAAKIMARSASVIVGSLKARSSKLLRRFPNLDSKLRPILRRLLTAQ